jgi:nitrous oxide reductase accessory protein NosL
MKNIITGILIILLFVSLSFAEEVKPIKPSSKDKCGVCGMFVAKYQNWVAEIVFKDGTYAFFDGAKDMLKYYHSLSTYNPSKKISDIAEIYVTEYYSVKMLPAEKVFFVKGSDVYGPMGEEFVPIETEKKAKEFIKDHNGKKILRFSEITTEDLK